MLGLAAAVAAMAAAPYHGGWAIVTMHEWPEMLEAGTPTTLTFSIRQHGEELLAGREPVLRLRGPGLFGSRERVRAERTNRPGVYRASFTPEEAGELRVTVDTDYNGWTVPMLPLAVRASGVSLASATAVPSRGQALFVAKGCAGCHAKTDDAALGDIRTVRAGPDLHGRTFPAGWIESKILDPESQRPAVRGSNGTMPRLEVSALEAAAIATYLNTRAVADARR